MPGLAGWRPAGQPRGSAVAGPPGRAVCGPGCWGLGRARPAAGSRPWVRGLGEGFVFDQDGDVRRGAVPLGGGAGVEGGFAGADQAVHPPLRRGPAVTLPARRAERLRGGAQDLVGDRVPAGPRQHPGRIEGQAERQVALVPAALLAFVRRVRIGPVGHLLGEPAEPGGVQPRRVIE